MRDEMSAGLTDPGDDGMRFHYRSTRQLPVDDNLAAISRNAK
jgi:hypothetical protein